VADFADLPEDPDDRNTDGFATWLDSVAAAASEDELFERLAGQRPPAPRLARQQVRGRLITILNQKFKEFGSGGAAARTADAWLQEGGELDDLQGLEFVAEEIRPWETSVGGAEVLDEVAALFDVYVYATEEARNALTLWLAYSHAFDCFGVSPLLDISSPTKRCGKSTGVVVLRHLTRAPLLSSNITPAALFRAVAAWTPTLLIDEADTFTKMNDELRGILNAGHTRDTAFVIRAEGEAKEPRLFSTWAPKVVAAIGRLPDTIEDRSIRVVLTRKPSGMEKRDAFDPERVRSDCEPIRRRLLRFVLDNVDAIATARVERPAGLNDRAWNNWRPLLAVAAVAGGDWLDRAKRTALALSGDPDDGEDEDVGTLALQHVWEALEPAERLSTADVLEFLIAKDEGPWAKWWESQVRRGELKSPAASLARLLRPFGIRPKQFWVGGSKTRGYEAEDFIGDAVAVYLRRDGKTGRDGRRGSSTEAIPTDPTDPTVFSGRERARPGLGEEGFVRRLKAAYKGGQITHNEVLEHLRIHGFVLRRTLPANEQETHAAIASAFAGSVAYWHEGSRLVVRRSEELKRQPWL
jgi:hypothetical protein